MQLLKSQLRSSYQEKRNELSNLDRENLSKDILYHFIKRYNPQKNDKIHVFLSMKEKGEIDTQLWIQKFLEIGMKIFVPRIAENILESVEIDENTQFSRNHFGVLEPLITYPSSKERNYKFVLTPLLYCDRFGNRVGYGKGFYDRFLASIPSETKKIGVNFFSPKEDVLDTNENDIPVDYLVSPTEILSFMPKSMK